MSDNRKKGDYGEGIAREMLADAGYEILTANFRCAAGEIDIIAEKDKELVFVEVKFRRGIGFGYPAEAVTPAKQRRIRAAASYYIYKNSPRSKSFRFDVVQIINAEIEHIENAF